MDSSQAPLISNESREEDLEYEADDRLDSASDAGKGPDGTPSIFVIVLTFAAGISGLLFGCMNRSSLFVATVADMVQMILVSFPQRSFL